MLALLRLLFLNCCLLASLHGYAQMKIDAQLRSIESDRYFGEYYLQKGNYNEAWLRFNDIAGNMNYGTPYDYLNITLSYIKCTLFKVKDTAHFFTNLDKAIENGADSKLIHQYMQPLRDEDKASLDKHLRANYDSLRQKGYAHFDTDLISEVNKMYPNILSAPNKRQDAKVYKRLVELSAGPFGFPGYHKCGIFAKIVPVLLHLNTYYDSTQWQEMFGIMMQATAEGNLSPEDMERIVDDYYKIKTKIHCTLYGHWTGKTPILCDCNNVDYHRRQIGLVPLENEYRADSTLLPACYKKPGPVNARDFFK